MMRLVELIVLRLLWLAKRVLGRIVFRKCKTGPRLYAAHGMRVIADGTITIGDRVYFLDGMLPAEIICKRGGELIIGDNCGFNYGVSIEAHARIVIGDRCIFGALTRIGDRRATECAPITIGNDVWVGHAAIIEPGVTIGEGSVISAGSVVVSDVPAQSMAIGNPARALRLDAVAKPKA